MILYVHVYSKNFVTINLAIYMVSTNNLYIFHLLQYNKNYLYDLYIKYACVYDNHKNKIK